MAQTLELIPELERVCEPYLFRRTREWRDDVPPLIRRFVDAAWPNRDGWGHIWRHPSTGTFIFVFRRYPENYYILYADPDNHRVGVSYQRLLQPRPDPDVATPPGWVRQPGFDNLWWYSRQETQLAAKDVVVVPPPPPPNNDTDADELWHVVPPRFRRTNTKPL